MTKKKKEIPYTAKEVRCLDYLREKQEYLSRHNQYEFGYNKYSGNSAWLPKYWEDEFAASGFTEKDYLKELALSGKSMEEYPPAKFVEEHFRMYQDDFYDRFGQELEIEFAVEDVKSNLESYDHVAHVEPLIARLANPYVPATRVWPRNIEDIVKELDIENDSEECARLIKQISAEIDDLQYTHLKDKGDGRFETCLKIKGYFFVKNKKGKRIKLIADYAYYEEIKLNKQDMSALINWFDNGGQAKELPYLDYMTLPAKAVASLLAQDRYLVTVNYELVSSRLYGRIPSYYGASFRLNVGPESLNKKLTGDFSKKRYDIEDKDKVKLFKLAKEEKTILSYLQKALEKNLIHDYSLVILDENKDDPKSKAPVVDRTVEFPSLLAWLEKKKEAVKQQEKKED